MNIFVVIPTVRSLSFLTQWANEFKSCNLLVVEDHEKKEIRIPQGDFRSTVHISWEDIRKDFGKNEWIFPRQNAGIRSYGFWKAYNLGADIIITLDDDCYPVDKNFVGLHVNNLSMRAPEGWTTTFPHRDFIFTRGIPYGVRNARKVAVSHGLWTNQIDLDAKTQLKYKRINLPPYPSTVQFIAPGVYFPMCSMNLAFWREITPLMYFPLMGNSPALQPWGYDRFDDIWAGIIVKKILDHLHLSVINGSPFVEHRKASDPHKNLIKEKEGLRANEWFWRAVERITLTKKTPVSCYRELCERIQFPKSRYFSKLREAMFIWSELFL